MQEVTGKPQTTEYTAPTYRPKFTGTDLTRKDTFKRLTTLDARTIRMRSQERTKEDLEYERQKDECTFRPKIRATSPLAVLPSSYSVQ